jgi:propanol-preferring alcohol dehydrogenase
VSSAVPAEMRAMVLDGVRGEPGGAMSLQMIPVPDVSEHDVLLRVHACGVCRTDLHVVDGELTEPALPLVPGHQIVGTVVAVGAQAESALMGQRVGVPWLGGSCGCCRYCESGRENLCDSAVYTGYQHNGGFAEYAAADARYCFPVPDSYTSEQAAPLLCAGLIGYRAWRMAKEIHGDIQGDMQTIGLYGFGAAAHILTQVARHEGKTVYAFTRPCDEAAQQFARSLGADWAGDSSQPPPALLDAAIIFAPDGSLVPAALKAVCKGGRVVCAGIHMSDIPGFPYEDLWGERSIVSVANLTRQDGKEFLPLAASIPVHTEVHVYPLDQANEALDDLRAGRFTGAAVVRP